MTIYVVDGSEEDENGQPKRLVIETYEVGADGLLSPPPDSREYSGAKTEAELRRALANSSFLSVWDRHPDEPPFAPVARPLA